MILFLLNLLIKDKLLKEYFHLENRKHKKMLILLVLMVEYLINHYLNRRKLGNSLKRNIERILIGRRKLIVPMKKGQKINILIKTYELTSTNIN